MEKTYEGYQESQLPWIRKIPSHWEWLRNGILLHNHCYKVGDRYGDYQLLSLTTTGIKEKNINEVSGKVPESYEGYQEVFPGDMVFCLFDLDCSAVFSGLSGVSGMITSAYDVAKPNNVFVSNGYLKYWFESVFAGRYYKIFSKSVRYTINYDSFKVLKTPVPPKPEQDQIVRYLDWKTNEIDRFIRQKKKQIRKLEEYRLTLIDNAISYGIQKSRKMKTSGTQWIEQIPSEWELVPAKRLFRESKELRHENDVQCTASQKYGIISQAEYMAKEKSRVVVADQGLENWKHVDIDDFVISLRSFQGGIERSAVEGCVTWHYIVLKPSDEVNPEFYKWLFKSRLYIRALQTTSEFIRDGQDLRFSNFVKVPLFRIPYKEQKEIAAYLTVINEKLNKMIVAIGREIELIEELKTGIIANVVTGQIDVRDEFIPEYSSDEDMETDDELNGEDDSEAESENEE